MKSHRICIWGSKSVFLKTTTHKISNLAAFQVLGYYHSASQALAFLPWSRWLTKALIFTKMQCTVFVPNLMAICTSLGWAMQKARLLQVTMTCWNWLPDSLGTSDYQLKSHMFMILLLPKIPQKIQGKSKGTRMKPFSQPQCSPRAPRPHSPSRLPRRSMNSWVRKSFQPLLV